MVLSEFHEYVLGQGARLDRPAKTHYITGHHKGVGGEAAANRQNPHH